MYQATGVSMLDTTANALLHQAVVQLSFCSFSAWIGQEDESFLRLNHPTSIIKPRRCL